MHEHFLTVNEVRLQLTGYRPLTFNQDEVVPSVINMVKPYQPLQIRQKKKAFFTILTTGHDKNSRNLNVPRCESMTLDPELR